MDENMDEFAQPITSLAQLEDALKRGWIVMKVDRPVPELAAELGAEQDARVAALPTVVEDLRGLMEDVDRFAVIGQVMAWFMEDLAEPPPSHRTPAVLEFAAALALEQPTRAPGGHKGRGLDAGPFARLLDGLAQLLNSTPDVVIGDFARPDKPMWSLAERFIASELNTPIVSTDRQEEMLLRELSVNERLSRDLQSVVGFDCTDALQVYHAIFMRSLEAARAWGTETDGQPYHVAGCRLADYLCFAANGNDLASFGVEPSIVARFCELFAQPLGSAAVRLPGLTRVLRERPLLTDERGMILCLDLPLLLRALRPRLRDALNPDSKGTSGSRAGFHRWEKQEDRVVADLAEAALQRMGFHATGRAAKWHTSDDTSDVDVWAHLERQLLTFQIKTGRLRGWRSIRTFEGDLVKLVGDAITQDERFRDAIGRDDFAWVSQGVPPAIGEDPVTPIVLTLEDVSGCAVVSARLRDAGLARGRLPWITSLAHFEQALELLELPAVLIHFLHRRAILTENQLIQAVDEIDLVLEYLSSGLEFAIYGQPHFQGDAILRVSTYQFRHYQAWLEGQQGLGPPVSKPALPLPTGMQTLLQRLDRDRPAGYLQMSIALLDLPRATWPRLAAAWSYVTASSACSGPVRVVDPAFAFGDGSAQGFTFLRWVSHEQDPDAMRMILTRYCTVQKYRARAKLWYGVLIPASTKPVGPIVMLESDPQQPECHL